MVAKSEGRMKKFARILMEWWQKGGAYAKFARILMGWWQKGGVDEKSARIPVAI